MGAKRVGTDTISDRRNRFRALLPPVGACSCRDHSSQW
ncbi:hypothetical protein SXCC_02105 [Gluconacetobacter sp. SXCC-1]|nr:hypothetical protein SXCC_02105 [Gluconacetobacter sp. SXCC-1]